MFFPSFHVAYVETLVNSITFIFEPSGNIFKILEEFHNKVECWHKAFSINGRLDTTIFGGYATRTPPFPSTLPPPLVELLLRVVIIEVTTFRARITLVMET